jgi:hypothetical protein
MFSIYTSAFNIVKTYPKWSAALVNFSQFAGIDGEVVIAVNSSSDGTEDAVFKLAEALGNVKVIFTNFSKDDPLFEAKIKNEALQNTSFEFKIPLELNERIPLSEYKKWANLAEKLESSEFLCAALSEVKLCDSPEFCSAIVNKIYLHKSGFYIGVPSFARGVDMETDFSKGCLVDFFGHLPAHCFVMNEIRLSTALVCERIIAEWLPYVLSLPKTEGAEPVLKHGLNIRF